jgi:hypothetical protein
VIAPADLLVQLLGDLVVLVFLAARPTRLGSWCARPRSIQIFDRHCSRRLAVVEVECSTEPRIAINCAVICSHDRRRVATASSATSRQLVHA